MFRPLYRHYYPSCDAIVFVVDTSDSDRLPQAARELHALLNEREFVSAPRIPVLVYANKQDITTLGTIELWEALQLSAFDQGNLSSEFGVFDICLQPCCAKTNEGLTEGMDWLRSQLPEFAPPKGPPRNVAYKINKHTKGTTLFDLTFRLSVHNSLHAHSRQSQDFIHLQDGVSNVVLVS